MENKFNNWLVQFSNIVPNSNNPFDQAGRKHNELMSTIELNGNREMSTIQVYNMVDNVIYNEYCADIHNFSSQTFATPILNFQDMLEMKNYVNSLNINDNAKRKFLVLADILMNYEVVNLSTILSDIVSFENNLVTEIGSDKNIYSQVLIASSIGRYSLCYWHDRLLSNSVKQDNRAPFWKKFFVALADALGGLAGGVAGSSTVIGGIAGSVTGAISTSTGFAKLWDIFAE